ncbi:MAG: hypothetical protein WCG80_16855 [Spirochaetales bacterium]
MPFVDAAYYLKTYFGTDPGQGLERLIARASDDVELACPAGIVLADLDATQLTLVKKATCAQVEFYVSNGDTFNEPERAGSVSIGAFQQTVGYQQRKSPASLCPRAMAYLEQSGLIYRAVGLL